MARKSWTNKEDLFLLTTAKSRNLIGTRAGKPYIPAINQVTDQIGAELKNISGNKRTSQAMATRFYELTRKAGGVSEAIDRIQSDMYINEWDRAESSMKKASDGNLMLVNSALFNQFIKEGINPFDALVKSQE